MADLAIGTVKLKSVGPVSVETAQVALTAGQAVYRNSSGNYDLLAGTTEVSSAGVPIGGVSLNAADALGSFMLAKPGAKVDLGATLTLNAEYRASTTAGGITSDAAVTGEYNYRIGTATATDELTIDVLTGAKVP